MFIQVKFDGNYFKTLILLRDLEINSQETIR